MVYNTLMRIILAALNAKFIHSSLALRSLKAYCTAYHPGISIREFTINDSRAHIVASLVDCRPDLLCFSCYIWNIRQTLDIAETVRKILPECKIVLGGPEVSYDSEALMGENPYIDFIIAGEGEQTFLEFLNRCKEGTEFDGIKGLSWRRDGRTVQNDPRQPISLDSVPFAYQDGFQDLKNRIIYYETSRGCPYQCQYCLSSTTGRVRFLSMDRVKEELAYFVRSGIKQVKLVDRTFNCKPDRAKEIFTFLINLGGNTNFHFEMAGDLIDEEMLMILSRAPEGMFQFEIGVQSTNEMTLESIRRKSNLTRLESSVRRLIEMDNIHIHLDLIAGLPNEDLSSMARSLNQVMKLSPHRLQLGFLKLLKGSGLREAARKYEYKYTSYPPYEVLSNHVMSFSELIRLKQMEELIELYYNSHRFERSIEYLAGQLGGDYYHLFNGMVDFWRSNDYFQYSHSILTLYEYLLAYGSMLPLTDMQLFRELLRFDYVLHEKPSRYPKGLEPLPDREKISQCHEFLRREENLEKILPLWKGRTPGQILRRIQLEIFQYRMNLHGRAAYQKEQTVLLFDYQTRHGVLRRPKIIPLNI